MVTAAEEWKSSLERFQSDGLAGLPGGGPGTVQGPREVSKPSVGCAVPPMTTLVLSTKTPRPPVLGSEMYEIASSTFLPA